MSFQAAADWLSGNTQAAHLSNDIKLELYGLFKFVTTGQLPDTSRPSIFYPTPRAKYDAWVREHKKYSSQGETGVATAKERYMAIAKSVGWSGEAPAEEEEEIDFDADEPVRADEKRSGLGPRVSVMSSAVEDETISSTPIHDAVFDNSADRLRAAISKDGADINAKDENGNTALHLAVDRGHTALVAILCDGEADLTLVDEDGQTPLEIAQALQRKDIITLLSS